MPLWGPNRFWPGSGLVLRCLGPGFTVLALGPGFRPIFIFIHMGGMNEGIHLDLDTWIVPGQIRKANLCRGLGIHGRIGDKNNYRIVKKYTFFQ